MLERVAWVRISTLQVPSWASVFGFPDVQWEIWERGKSAEHSIISIHRMSVTSAVNHIKFAKSYLGFRGSMLQASCVVFPEVLI